MFCEFCGNTVPSGASACASCIPSTIDTAKELNATAERASAAARDALVALRAMIVDPIVGAGTSFTILERKRALDAGIALGVVFDLAIVIAVQIGARKTLGFLSPLVLGDSSFISLVKAIVLGAVPAVAMIATIAAAQKVFGRSIIIEGVVLVATLSLMPLGAMALLSAFLGVANFEVVVLLLVIMASSTTLILFGGFRDVLGLASNRSALAVPLTFVVAAWLSKVIAVVLS